MEKIENQAHESSDNRLTSRLFPADELKIPLSIYVPDSYRDDAGRINSARFRPTRHHRFAPKKNLIHKHGDMGKILRYSCLQIVPEELHVQFNKHFDKPLLPETQAEKFGAVLLSVARYLPAEAIDLGDSQPTRRELELSERQRIWSNNELRPEQGSKVQREIQDYVATRKVEGLDENLVDEFLNTPSDETRIQRGKQLFRIAAEVAVEPIAEAYIDAWDSGLLPRQDIRLETSRLYDIVQARAVPKSPGRFIVRHVIKDKYAMERTLKVLQGSLEAQYA